MPSDDKFVRDQNSSALLNTDREALENYKKTLDMSKRISNLENDIGDIKDMLRQLINNKN